jgi:DNA mismatch repair protein MutS
MTALAARLPQVGNVTMDVREWRDQIVFLHKVKPGAADRSYGIQVAKLAGLPAAVTGRAGEVLALLEKADSKPSGGEALLDGLPLFAARPTPEPPPAAAGPGPLELALAELQPDELTPKEALEAIYRLKELAEKRSR